MGNFVQRTLKPILETFVTKATSHEGLIQKYQYQLKENKNSDFFSAAGLGLLLVVLALLLAILLIGMKEIQRHNRDHVQALAMLAQQNKLINEVDRFPNLIRLSGPPHKPANQHLLSINNFLLQQTALGPNLTIGNAYQIRHSYQQFSPAQPFPE